MKTIAVVFSLISALFLVACGGSYAKPFTGSNNWRDAQDGQRCSRKPGVSENAYNECLIKMLDAAQAALAANPTATASASEPATSLSPGGQTAVSGVGSLVAGAFVETGTMNNCPKSPLKVVMFTNKSGYHLLLRAGMRLVPYECNASDRLIKVPTKRGNVVTINRLLPPDITVYYTRVDDAGGYEEGAGIEVEVDAYLPIGGVYSWKARTQVKVDSNVDCWNCRAHEPPGFTFRPEHFRRY